MTIFQFFIHVTIFLDRYLIPLIFAVAIIVFIIGVYRFFIAGAGEDEKRKEGRTFILYGIGGLVVMVSLWGIVNLLVSSLGMTPDARARLPSFFRMGPDSPRGAPLIRDTGPTTNTGDQGTCSTETCQGICESNGYCNPLY